MNSFFNYLSKAIFILQEKKRYLIFLLISFITLSVLDIIGISLVTAFMSLLLNSENIIFDSIKKIFLNLHILSSENFINFLILSIIILYTFKSLITYLIQLWIVNFSLNFEAWLRSKLMRSYIDRPYRYMLNENAGDIINVAGIYTNTFQTSVLMQGIKLVSELTVITMVMIFLALNNFSSVLAIVLIFLG